MFGILNLLFTGGAWAVGQVKDGIENSESRDRAINKGQSTYINNRGREIDIKTGHQMCTYWDEHGDKHVKDLKTYVDRNVSEEKRQREYMEAKRNPNGATVIKFFDSKDNNKIKYRDLNNGKVYTTVSITTTNWIKDHKAKGIFYVDCSTGELVRPIDDKEKCSGDYEWLMKFINEFTKEHPIYRKCWAERNNYEELDICGGKYYIR